MPPRRLELRGPTGICSCSRTAAAPAAPVEEGEQQDEQLKVEQQQEQQGGVQVEQQAGEGASIAQHEAELQVER